MSGIKLIKPCTLPKCWCLILVVFFSFVNILFQFSSSPHLNSAKYELRKFLHFFFLFLIFYILWVLASLIGFTKKNWFSTKFTNISKIFQEILIMENVNSPDSNNLILPLYNLKNCWSQVILLYRNFTVVRLLNFLACIFFIKFHMNAKDFIKVYNVFPRNK